MTFRERLGSMAGDRAYLVALATANAVVGLAALAILAPLTFGGDVDIFRRGAEAIQDGVIAPDFLYAPLAAVLATPLTWVPLPVAAMGMTLTSLGILLVGVRLETRRLATPDRILIAVATLGFLPVVYELVVGQVTMLIAASVYPIRDRDGVKRGILLGIVLALMPKPLLVPLLFWMLLHRRRALAGAAMAAMAVTVLGVLLLGPDPYSAWEAALTGTSQITRQGNLAFTALLRRELVLPLIAVTVAIMVWTMVRDERRGFVAALVGAMLVQPFTLMYAVSLLLVAVRPALAVTPRATKVLALVANPAVLLAFAPWAVMALLSVAPVPYRADAGSGRPQADDRSSTLIIPPETG